MNSAYSSRGRKHNICPSVLGTGYILSSVDLLIRATTSSAVPVVNSIKASYRVNKPSNLFIAAIYPGKSPLSSPLSFY